jgi:hypothetical protein
MGGSLKYRIWLYKTGILSVPAQNKVGRKNAAAQSHENAKMQACGQ